MPKKAARNAKQKRDKTGLAKRRSVKNRLQNFISTRYRNRNRFCKHVGLTHSTVNGWFSEPPKVPDGARLMKVSEATKMSADWLLFGEGPELRGTAVPTTNLASALRKQLLAEIAVGRSPRAMLEVERSLPDPKDLLSEIVDTYKRRAERALDEIWSIRQQLVATHVRERIASGASEATETLLRRLEAAVTDRKEALPADIVPPQITLKEHKGPIPPDTIILADDGTGMIRHMMPGDVDHPGRPAEDEANTDKTDGRIDAAIKKSPRKL